MKSHKVTMLGTGLIGMFYTMTLHNQRGADRVHIAYSRREERATAFAEEWNIPHATTDLAEAITILRRTLLSSDYPTTCT